jgi:hypothetical protein
MKRMLATATVLAAVGLLIASPSRPTADLPRPIKADEFLLTSVRDGLAEDGVDPALARALGRRDDDFVPKCTICGMTRKGLLAYGDLKSAPAAEKGKGLPEELAKRLKSDVDATRGLALRELVQRYIERGYVRAEFTPQQRAAVQKELEQWRKDAMPGLREGQKFCPSCDGACRLTPKL